MGKSRHKRRDRYWQLYDFAHSRELPAVIDELARLVDEIGDPWPTSKRGRPPVHSPRKMAVVCVLTVTLGISYRNMETLLYILHACKAIVALARNILVIIHHLLVNGEDYVEEGFVKLPRLGFKVWLGFLWRRWLRF